MTGRPSLLTPTTSKIICLTVAAGGSRAAGARAAKVSTASVASWTRQGEAEQERIDVGMTPQERKEQGLPSAKEAAPYLAFLNDLAVAGDAWEKKLLATITEAAASDPKHWQAAKWLLSKHDRERWGETNRTEISGPGGKPIEIETKTAAELLALADELTGGYREEEEA